MTGKTNSASKKIELEEVTVNPGASDVIKTADDGKGFSKVTVHGDADLIAANIREGVDIFGILGTLKEGLDVLGMTEFEKIAVDEFTPSNDAASMTINHSLGRRPLVVIVLGKNLSQNAARFLNSAHFFSENSSSQYGKGGCTYKYDGKQFTTSDGSATIQLAYNSTTQIAFSNSSYPLHAGATYTVITMG